MKNCKPICFFLPEADKAKLKELSVAKNFSLSVIIRLALKDYLAKYGLEI